MRADESNQRKDDVVRGNETKRFLGLGICLKKFIIVILLVPIRQRSWMAPLESDFALHNKHQRKH